VQGSRHAHTERDSRESSEDDEQKIFSEERAREEGVSQSQSQSQTQSRSQSQSQSRPQSQSQPRPQEQDKRSKDSAQSGTKRDSPAQNNVESAQYGGQNDSAGEGQETQNQDESDVRFPAIFYILFMCVDCVFFCGGGFLEACARGLCIIARGVYFVLMYFLCFTNTVSGMQIRKCCVDAFAY
jgi:hypothetical protein